MNTNTSKNSKRKKTTKKKPVDYTKSLRTKYLIDCYGKYTEPYLRELAEYLIGWAKLPTSLVFGKFLMYQDLSYDDFDLARKKSQDLDIAHGKALQFIGSNREERALVREIDYKTMRFMQSTYDKRWKQQEIFLAQLKDQSQQQGDIKIILPSLGELIGENTSIEKKAEVIDERRTPDNSE